MISKVKERVVGSVDVGRLETSTFLNSEVELPSVEEILYVLNLSCLDSVEEEVPSFSVEKVVKVNASALAGVALTSLGSSVPKMSESLHLRIGFSSGSGEVLGPSFTVTSLLPANKPSPSSGACIVFNLLES